MKTAILKNAFWLLGLFLTLGFGFVACDDDDDDTSSNEVRYRNLVLTGPQETPPNNSTRTATIDAVYNKNTNVLTYTITWGFDATNMHFHKRTDPQPGPVALAIPKVPATATTFISPLTTSQTLTDAQEAELLNNEWYLNIHTSAFPLGELRVNMVPN